MSKDITAEVFLNDVSKHRIDIRLDVGVHRHLHFMEPKNSNHWFEIVTWPGSLCIRGDMGTWMFSRVDDMFNFFRSENLRINPSYWSEKLQNGVHGGKDQAMEFDAALFEEEVFGRLEDWDLEPAELAEVKEALTDEVFNQEHESPHAYYAALYDFKCNGVEFDCEMPDGKKYTYHYLWCLYAIVWGIQQYDARKLCGPNNYPCDDCGGSGVVDEIGGEPDECRTGACIACNGQGSIWKLCEGCPPHGYPTDKTRCSECPRRQ